MKKNKMAHGSRKSFPTSEIILACSVLGFLGGCATQPESHVLSSPPPVEPTSSVASTTTTTTNITTSDTTGQKTIIVTQAQPPPKQNVIIARPDQPTAAHVWIDGYWTWRNSRYEWMPGHWELPESSGATWVPPHTEKEGTGYRFYEGYWKY